MASGFDVTLRMYFREKYGAKVNLPTETMEWLNRFPSHLGAEGLVIARDEILRKAGTDDRVMVVQQ